MSTAAVKGLWQNIQRELGTCRQINIDTTRTMARYVIIAQHAYQSRHIPYGYPFITTFIRRLQSITLQDNGSPLGMVLSDAVHPFENLIDKDNFRPDWFFNLRPCEKHYSHIYTTDASLVESPPLNVLPSTRLEFDDLEFDIQDAISIDNDEGSIGSRTWKTIGHHQEMEENLSLIGISDTIWHSAGEHEETLSQVRGQDILPRPLAISLPGVNEALSDSTILKPSSVVSYLYRSWNSITKWTI
ncbi:hypothetical protein BC943DRAFT_381337 [Umbelopsis sp. AD052]|nr:hypothetical protein BC943DRAFT_381337 [Umbelopsis sp. AD052]